MSGICPVCGYPDLSEPAYLAGGNPSWDICPSCGTQFGLSDWVDSNPAPLAKIHEELRRKWIGRGMRWYSQADPIPLGWDPIAQLRNIEH